jgi:hypothetical protein
MSDVTQRDRAVGPEDVRAARVGRQGRRLDGRQDLAVTAAVRVAAVPGAGEDGTVGDAPLVMCTGFDLATLLTSSDLPLPAEVPPLNFVSAAQAAWLA